MKTDVFLQILSCSLDITCLTSRECFKVIPRVYDIIRTFPENKKADAAPCRQPQMDLSETIRAEVGCQPDHFLTLKPNHCAAAVYSIDFLLVNGGRHQTSLPSQDDGTLKKTLFWLWLNGHGVSILVGDLLDVSLIIFRQLRIRTGAQSRQETPPIRGRSVPETHKDPSRSDWKWFLIHVPHIEWAEASDS